MSSITVTATAGGSTANGILLRVLVLNNATLGAAPYQLSSAGASSVEINANPPFDGGLLYGVACMNGATGAESPFTPGSTGIDLVFDSSHGEARSTYVSDKTTTAGTVVPIGGLNTGTSGCVSMAGVQKFGGDIATDPSSPAVANTNLATTVTTAAFNPPVGSLLLVLVSSNGGAGVTTMSVTTSSGLPLTLIALGGGSAGQQYAGIFAAVIPPPPQIATTNVPGGAVGVPYSFTLSATSGTPPYSWSVASGALPTGLTLSAGGVISGTPTTTGVYSFTAQVTDSLSQTATATFGAVINANSTPGGVVRATWALAAGQYTYGTLAVPVSAQDHSWLFVSVSWLPGEDPAIAYCTDNVRNLYQPLPSAASGSICTQVFAVPNSRAVSTVYVSTSAFVRSLNVQVTEVTGLQPGYVLDASAVLTTGPGTTFTPALAVSNADFILAVGAFTGTPQTIGQAGTGATWTALTGSFNGNASTGVTQSLAWAETTGAASTTMAFTGVSSMFSGVMLAVKRAGGLPANPNPAWPVISCQAAFGYQPQQPAVQPTWTDITSRFLGFKGQRGRSFELDELRAADVTCSLDNFDGALSPQNVNSPFWPNVTLITPVRVIATWQGRSCTLFRGMITSLPQTYDFQRGLSEVTATDDFSKLAQILLATCMTQEMLFDNPLDLWPLNDQQGAVSASNWSGRSPAGLTPTAAQQGGGNTPTTQLTVAALGTKFGVFSSLVTTSSGSTTTTGGTTASTSNTPATGFGNSNSGAYPGALAGTTDSVWGNSAALIPNTSVYQGTVLVDSGDATLPLTATGATYSVWAQMLSVPLNLTTGAMVMTLTDAAGTAGGKKYLAVYYDGTSITVSQTTGSHVFTPASPLFDGGWHLWTVTISTAGLVTLYLDAAALGSYTATMPAGSPTMLQWGGDATITPTSSAGLFTGSLSLAGVYDRVVDAERIKSWFLSGSTGFADELGGERIQRVLAWTRWSAPQAIDRGAVRQQQFNYLTGGYGNNGLTGAIGNWNTAGGSTAIDNGAQSDVTIQDVANTENGLLFMLADGALAFRQFANLGSNPAGLALGDMDYPLNLWERFEGGLGPWTSTVSCTVAQSSGWAYAGQHSALVTVTGTPVQAYAWGDSGSVNPASPPGFSCWVMSPQGCFVQAMIDWQGTLYSDTYDATYGAGYGDVSGFGYISTSSGPVTFCPPMTPVFLSLTGVTAPPGAVTAFPHPTIVSSPATGTQLYFDRPRLSPPGFQVPYDGNVEIIEDVQYLYNDVAVTRNVDQATYRARDAASRTRYYPRIYTRTIFASADDPTAVTNTANRILAAYSQPQLRVSRVTVNAAENPELWPFVLSADVGDTVPFTRNPVGGAAVTGTFTILGVEPDVAPDKATFTYLLAPGSAF